MINRSEVTVNVLLQKLCISINSVLLNFLFIKEQKKIMTTEGSCDTIIIAAGYRIYFFYVLQYYSFYFIFDQINAALVNIRDVFQKHTNSKLLNSSVYLYIWNYLAIIFILQHYFALYAK